MSGIIKRPPPEGHQERLGEKVISGIVAKPTRNITVDGPSVTVVQPGEVFRQINRPADQRGVVQGGG